jgi:hypothetical protein
LIDYEAALGYIVQPHTNDNQQVIVGRDVFNAFLIPTLCQINLLPGHIFGIFTEVAITCNPGINRRT